MGRRPLVVVLVVLLLGTVVGYPPGSTVRALAVSGVLPGGTAIAVTIDAPADGVVLRPGPVTLSGTASVGTGAPTPNTALIYVLDVSASTSESPGVDCDPGKPNDVVLDCEIAAAKELNDVAVAARSVPYVGAAAFATAGVTADVVPGSETKELIAAPQADGNANNTPDIDEVLSSAFTRQNQEGQPVPREQFGASGGYREFTRVTVDDASTNFAEGIKAAVDVADAAPSQLTKIVAFMSDGKDLSSDIMTDEFLARVAEKARIYTFAVGSNSSCDGPTETT